MDFRDAPEEAAFRERLRGWLTEQKGKFPTSGDEYWAKAGEWHVALYEAGFFGTSWPAEYGGQDLPPVYDVIVDEEIAKAGAPARPSLGYLVVGLSHHGSEELRQRFLPGMINGTERWCQGFSEPGAGSDLASLTTTAVRDGDEYVITGHKIWTSYSDVADWCLVLARTDKDVPKHKGISAFIVESGMPGVTKGKKELKLGIHASDTREIYYENARIPKDCLFGELNKGYTVALATLGGGRIGIAAQALGIAQAAVEASVRYANERTQFDRKIGEFDAIRHMLADSMIELETARLLVYQAAWLRDQQRPHTKEASLAKWHASEAATRCANLAIQVHGGYGYMSEYHVERYWRDARICEIYEGTTEVQKMVVAGQVLKEHAIGG